MKKRFLPFSLLLVIMVLGQSVMAGQVGHYVPRVKEANTAEAYLSSLRVNQHTGLIDPAWMIKAGQQAQAAESLRDEVPVYWVSMGPDNFGGRTTSIVYNKANMNEVYIGSMGGGVFYTWNLGVTWHQVGDNLMVSCMTQAEDGTIYVGTGDGLNAASYNAMSDFSHANSFAGTGLYKINNNVMEVIPSTQPAVVGDDAEWAYINGVAMCGNNIVVATSDGLRYSEDKGATWKYAKCNGEAMNLPATGVTVASDNTVIAAVEGNLYMGTLENMVCYSETTTQLNEQGQITKIATASGLLDFAVASDPNVIYAAAIGSSGQHEAVYASYNKGQTWQVALPSVSSSFGHEIFEERGLLNHALTVDPANSDRLYVCGYTLWRLDRPTSSSDGYFNSVNLSAGNDVWIHEDTYLHVGLNAIAFDPRNSNKCYIATDGGIFKGEKVANSDYMKFSNCNRGYISTRCFNVGVSGKDTRMIAGLADHGPILIEGDDDSDHLKTAVQLLPSVSPANAGYFEEDNHAGSCAVSVINSNAFVVCGKNGSLQRTETAGADYDISNFLGASNAPSFSSYKRYRLPMALWETFEDEYSVGEVLYYGKNGDKAGDVVQCFSNNARFPFNYTLTQDMNHGDSVFVHDPITAKFYLGIANKLYMTLDVLRFDVVPTWYVYTISGTPSTMSVSADGDVLYVGLTNGSLYRVSNLNHAVDASTCQSSSENFALEITKIETSYSQCITSIAINPNNPNKIVVTMGNYGNDQYVLFSNNALSETPTFRSVQGNLPLMPVYSSVVVMENGYVMLGTERGIWMTKNVNAADVVWVPAQDNMGNVPVMDLKQQVFYHETQLVPVVVDTITTYMVYPAINNQGVIYAATYGRGLFRCENYKQHIGQDVAEDVKADNMFSMYPNPVRDAAKLSFETSTDASVSYQVFDLMGRMVKQEVLGGFSAGTHEVNLSLNNLSTGTYILRLNVGANTSSMKFMMY